MNYDEATRFFYSLAPRGVSLGLGRVQRALAQRGSPERAYASVVVAGTNGKGSVASMLASILQASGLKVGLYTSPHLHRLVERFRVQGRPLGQREFTQRVAEMKPWLEAKHTPDLTFFEACTVLAFEVFRDASVDIAVLEVGLGGRLDATNVVTPLTSVITRIAMDHADRLGPTLRHIAREKAGVVKAGVPVIVGAREPAAQRVIRGRAQRLRAPRLEIDRDFAAEPHEGAYRVRVGEQLLRGVVLPLAGAYQADNLACAVSAAFTLRDRGLPIDDNTIRKGLARVRWPGRLELVDGAPSVLFDAAHNPDACAALAGELERLRTRWPKRVLVFGAMRDKEHAAMLALLGPCMDAVLFTTPDTARAMPAGELARRFAGLCVEEPVQAFERAKKLAGKRGLVVVAGSIFVMAAVRAHVLGLRSDPPIAM